VPREKWLILLGVTMDHGKLQRIVRKGVDSVGGAHVIDVYNHGKMRRDFTYIDDVVEGLTRVLSMPPTGNPNWDGAKPDPGSSKAPYRIYNIGNDNPVELLDFIEAIEEALGVKAKKRFLPMQPGDMLETAADVADLERDVSFRPKTGIREGIAKFVEWYLEYEKRGGSA